MGACGSQEKQQEPPRDFYQVSYQPERSVTRSTTASRAGDARTIGVQVVIGHHTSRRKVSQKRLTLNEVVGILADEKPEDQADENHSEREANPICKTKPIVIVTPVVEEAEEVDSDSDCGKPSYPTDLNHATTVESLQLPHMSNGGKHSDDASDNDAGCSQESDNESESGDHEDLKSLIAVLSHPEAEMEWRVRVEKIYALDKAILEAAGRISSSDLACVATIVRDELKDLRPAVHVALHQLVTTVTDTLPHGKELSMFVKQVLSPLLETLPEHLSLSKKIIECVEHVVTKSMCICCVDVLVDAVNTSHNVFCVQSSIKMLNTFLTLAGPNELRVINRKLDAFNKMMIHTLEHADSNVREESRELFKVYVERFPAQAEELLKEVPRMRHHLD